MRNRFILEAEYFLLYRLLKLLKFLIFGPPLAPLTFYTRPYVRDAPELFHDAILSLIQWSL